MTQTEIQELQRVAERAEGHYHHAVMTAVDKERCYAVNERAERRVYAGAHTRQG